MKTKICFKCKKEKPINEFHKDKFCKDGLCNWCEECDVDVKIEEICKEFDYYGETIGDMLQEREDRYVSDWILRYGGTGFYFGKTREVRLKMKKEKKRRKKEKKKLVKEIKKLSGKKMNKYLSLRIALDLISNMQLRKIRDYLKGREEQKSKG